jgi:DNA (cytosine-5)-methyltransferase 1
VVTMPELAAERIDVRGVSCPDRIIVKKLNRLARGAPARTLDLFAGCGGLSLGFQTAGFDIVGALEMDPPAVRSHARNFHNSLSGNALETHALPRDISTTEPEHLITELSLGKEAHDAVDVIVGGPPCQSFARVGRAKLREVFAHPKAFLEDPRSNLYLRYLEYVRKLKPVALLMENVPDALNYGGHNIVQEMCEVLEEMGYICRYTLLNSAYYGVPQMRERMFLIGYARELGKEEVDFPSPTHWVELPRGYKGSRSVALKALRKQFDLFENSATFYVPPPASNPVLPATPTAQDALGDLPPITLHLEGRLKRGARYFTEGIPYPEDVRPSPYAQMMRQYPGYERKEEILDHVIRYLPRDYEIFRRMKPGDQYPQAHRHAIDMLQEEISRLASNGIRIEPGTTEYEQLKQRIVPPYDPSKFPNKWRKMEANRPARTLMAHLGKDSYSHIHYDSKQARTISVREAARLQSFPDGFVFEGPMNPAFRQIGNAVPPLMAESIARAMINAIPRGKNAS